MKSIRGVVGFMKAVESGSFAAAARQLGVTPVAVSKAVWRLESELGVRLLQRTTRAFGLTEEGRLFHQNCRAPLQALEEAHAVARDRAVVAAGVVRVTSVSPFGRSFVTPLLPKFARLYPQVRVELDLDDSVTDMIVRRYDLGIRIGTLPDAGVVVREIAPLRFVVCGAPGYLAACGTPVEPADLGTHNCLCMRSRSSGQPLPWRLRRGQETVVAAVQGNLSCNDMTAVVTAALHGHGLACAPLPLVLPLLRAGALLPVLDGWVGEELHVYLHYPARRNLPLRVRLLIDFLLTHLRANPDLTSPVEDLIRR